MSKSANSVTRYSAIADTAYIFGSSAVFLLLFTVSRTLLLVRNSGLIADIPVSALLISYTVGFRFDLLVIGYTMTPLLAGMFFPAGLSHRRWWNLWLGLALVLFSFLAVMEPDFYREFHTRLNSLVFQYLKEDPKTVISMLWRGFPVLRFLLLCGVMAVSSIAALRLVDRRTRKPDTRYRYRSRLLIAIVLILLGFVSIRGTLRFGSPLRWGDAFHSSHLFANHLALNGAFTLAKAAEQYIGNPRENSWLNKMDEKEALDLVHRKWLLPQESLTAPEKYPLLRRFDPLTSAPASPYRNVVLILMESLSAQRIGVFGNTLNVTPSFDELSGEGLLFDHIFSNGTHTHQGMFATLGCFPNLPNYEYLMNQPEGSYRFSGLPKVLSGRNYDNVFVYNGDFAWDNQIGFFRAQGVSRFIGRNDFVNPRLLDPTWGVTDEDMFDRAFDEIVKLEKSDRPYYAILQTLSNHVPYSFPAPMPVEKVMVNGAEEGHLTAMRYSDYALGQFFRKIKNRGGFDDTLFVITGDHGFGGGALVTDMDLFRFHVPLLFIGKDIQTRFGKTNATVGSQVDIVPTVMGMLGGSYVHHCWGRDLLALPEGDPGRAVIKPSGNEQMVAFIEGETIIIKAPNTGPKLFRYKTRPVLSAEPIDDPNKLQQMQKELNAYLQTATHALLENHTGHNDEMRKK
jgi:phosphoglycerol transferase MdoB-like AlkP superfamily enzyme